MLVYFVLLVLSSNTISPLSDKDFALKVLKSHNAYRTKHGSEPLKLDDILKSKAEQLVKHAAKAKGFNDISAGENVYVQCATFKAFVIPREVVKIWYVKYLLF